MKVIVIAKFSKRLMKLKNKELAEDVINLVEMLKSVNSLEDIPHLKKMKGHDSAYRIRLGDYRIGLFLDDDTLILEAIDTRQNIYKKWP